jgi:hypothetical protein
MEKLTAEHHYTVNEVFAVLCFAIGCGAQPVSVGSRRRQTEWISHVVVFVLFHARFVMWVG